MGKFTLGAALLFEEITGKSITELGNPKISDMVAMLYAQENWDKKDPPSYEDYKRSIASEDLAEITKRLNGPFSQPAA